MKSVQMNIVPLRAAAPAGRSSNLPLLVRISPPANEPVLERPPLNLALVLDRSGSMSGKKLQLAKDAACNLVSNLTERDRVSVVAFDEQVTCMAPSAPVTDVAALHTAINAVRTAGQTALHQGWVEGGLQVSKHLAKDTTSRVILMTDGQANIGERNPDVLASHTRGLAERGVSTTTMGIGDDYDELLLEGMARAGDGNFYHIQSSAQFEQFFGLELSGLANLVGSKVRLELIPRASITPRVLNKLDRESGSKNPNGMLASLLGRQKAHANETLILSNMIADLPVEVCIVLALEDVPQDGKFEMLKVRLTWLDTDGRAQERLSALELPVVAASRLAEFPEDAEVAEKVVLLEIASLKLEANDAIREHKFEVAKKALQKAHALVEESPQSPEMVAEGADLAYIQEFLDQGQYASVSKHAYYQSHQRSHSKSGYSGGRDTR